MNYSVCFLFDRRGENVLLQVKGKTDFKGKLNGVGGKLAGYSSDPAGNKRVGWVAEETMEECAIREINEETGVMVPKDALKFVCKLSLPDQCEEVGKSILESVESRQNLDENLALCNLYYYCAFVDPDEVNMNAGYEELQWHKVESILACNVMDESFAGFGDLQYVIHLALRDHMPEAIESIIESAPRAGKVVEGWFDMESEMLKSRGKGGLLDAVTRASAVLEVARRCNEISERRENALLGRFVRMWLEPQGDTNSAK